MSKTISAAATGLPNRRTALLASLAGLGAAVSLPKVAKAAAASTDPIFAAIEKHKAANAAYEAALAPCGKVVGRDLPHLEGALDAATEAEEEARYDMHEAVPTTIAGLVAYVAYWSEYVGPYREDGMGQLTEIGWEAIPTIAEAMEALFPAPVEGDAA